jgi:hypothetical protein
MLCKQFTMYKGHTPLLEQHDKIRAAQQRLDGI